MMNGLQLNKKNRSVFQGTFPESTLATFDELFPWDSFGMLNRVLIKFWGKIRARHSTLNEPNFPDHG